MTRARPAPWACGTWGTWGKLGGRDATEHDGKLNVVLRNLQRLCAALPGARPRRFCTRAALVRGAEMVESRGITSVA
jgi:hypothetical protein